MMQGRNLIMPFYIFLKKCLIEPRPVKNIFQILNERPPDWHSSQRQALEISINAIIELRNQIRVRFEAAYYVLIRLRIRKKTYYSLFNELENAKAI